MFKSDAEKVWSLKDETVYWYPWDEDCHYFKYEPIKWRVLEYNNGNALLLADKLLDTKSFDTNGNGIWNESTIRSWLNSSDHGFFGTAFDEKEQNLIPTVNLTNDDSLIKKYIYREDGNSSKDKIYLLADTETFGNSAKKYGFKPGIVKQRNYRFMQ